MTEPVIFISYSHKDEKEKDRLLSHLGVLRGQGLIGLWSDDRIGAGADWEEEISEAMAQARVAILLISTNFLTSDFILGKEVPTLLKRRQSEGLIVFPVIAKACAWQQVDWLTEINVRPKNGRPIWGGSRRVDEDLAVIANEVAAIVKTVPPITPTSSSVPGKSQRAESEITTLKAASLAPPSIHSSDNLPFPPNPFGDTGRITDSARFFDREDLLGKIFEELSKGVNLSLIGESQVGKSSVLSMVCHLGPERLRLPPEMFVYLNLEWVDNEDDFYVALCETLGIETCRGFKLTRALRGKQYVLCLDEMEKMTWEGFTVQARSHLRGLADGREAPLKLVIASRSSLAYLFPDSPGLDSPLAGICHPLEVRPFSFDTAEAFLQQRLQGTGVTFTAAEIDTLFTQTNGHPAKFQRAAAGLYRHHASPGPQHAARY